MNRFTPRAESFPRRFDALKDGSFQIQMREAFIEQANDMLGRYRPRDPNMFQIGMEIEYSVVHFDGHITLVDEKIRNSAIAEFTDGRTHEPGFVTQELGAPQIEIATRPIDIKKNPGCAVLDEMTQCEGALKAFLAENNSHLLRIGCFPLIPIGEILRTTTSPKYQRCPDFHNQHRRPGMNYFIGDAMPIDVRDAAIPAITNAVQANFDCYDMDQALDLLNRSFVVSPFVTALGANAGFIDQKDSGLADMRYIAWQISHDIRSWDEQKSGVNTRVGMPSRYYATIEEYLESVLRHPFFMENYPKAFAMAIGTYWRDARLKFLPKPDGIQLVVELRPLSTQPTVEDDFGLLMFYIGRVYYDHIFKRPLLPIQYVKANKEVAMRFGRKGSYWTLDEHDQIRLYSFDDLFDREINLGMQGMTELAVDRKSVEFVRDRIRTHYRTEAPVDRFRTLVQNEVAESVPMVEAMESAIASMKLIVT